MLFRRVFHFSQWNFCSPFKSRSCSLSLSRSLKDSPFFKLFNFILLHFREGAESITKRVSTHCDAIKKRPGSALNSSTALLINTSNRVDQLQKNFTLNFWVLSIFFTHSFRVRTRKTVSKGAGNNLPAEREGYACTIIPSIEWDSLFSTCNFTTHSKASAEEKDQKSKIIDFPEHWNGKDMCECLWE